MMKVSCSESVGVETVLVLGTENPNRDEAMIRAVARALAWMSECKAGSSLTDVAAKIGWTTSPLRQRLKLASCRPPSPKPFWTADSQLI